MEIYPKFVVYRLVRSEMYMGLKIIIIMFVGMKKQSENICNGLTEVHHIDEEQEQIYIVGNRLESHRQTQIYYIT